MSRGTSNCSSKPCRNPVEILSNPTSVSTAVTTFLKLCCHHCRNPTPASVGFRQLFDVSNFSGKVADINPHQFCIGIFEFSSTFIFIFISQQSPGYVTHCLCFGSVGIQVFFGSVGIQVKKWGIRNCRVPDTRCSSKLARGGLDGSSPWFIMRCDGFRGKARCHI